MDITRCDKCGKEVYKTPYRFNWLKGTKPIDLCSNCWPKFAEIVNNFLKDKNGNWLVKIPDVANITTVHSQTFNQERPVNSMPV